MISRSGRPASHNSSRLWLVRLQRASRHGCRASLSQFILPHKLPRICQTKPANTLRSHFLNEIMDLLLKEAGGGGRAAGAGPAGRHPRA